MTEEEKWEEEFDEWFRQQDPEPPKQSMAGMQDTHGDWTMRYFSAKFGYLQACRKGQGEMEKLKGYEILFEDLKERVTRDREKGLIQKTARAWLLVQKYEEAK